EIARGREQVVELDRLVALDARHRRLARRVALGEAVDHRLLEAALVVEHVVRNADVGGDAARVVDVAAGAAGALAVGCLAVVVELQGDADDVVALGLEQRRRHRRVDAARHGDDDARILRRARKIETVEHPCLAAQAPRSPWADLGPAWPKPSARPPVPAGLSVDVCEPRSLLYEARAPAQ